MAKRALRVASQAHLLDLEEVEEFAEGLPTKYLQCRELGHTWQPYTAGAHRDGGFERTLRCSRCKTQRVQHLSSSGLLMGNSKMIYPDGYLRKGKGRIDSEGRGLLRIHSIQRAFKEVS